MARDFYELFKIRKPIIGMIHLAGQGEQEIIKRALQEVGLYAREGLSGAIVEDYHCGNIGIMNLVLGEISSRKPEGFEVGVNYLRNPFFSLKLAKDHGFNFVQIDVIAGNYQESSFNESEYEKVRNLFPDVSVLGGVNSIDDSNLKNDLEDAVKRAEAIVVTGEETGVETPHEKIAKFRGIIGQNFPLIVGSGLNPRNAYEQLVVADGAIVGSSLKSKNDTYQHVVQRRVKELMKVVKVVRNLEEIL